MNTMKIILLAFSLLISSHATAGKQVGFNLDALAETNTNYRNCDKYVEGIRDLVAIYVGASADTRSMILESIKVFQEQLRKCEEQNCKQGKKPKVTKISAGLNGTLTPQ
jgi:hypothetical protein